MLLIAGLTGEDIFSQIYHRVYKRGYKFSDLLQGLQERIYFHRFTAGFTREDIYSQIYRRFTREDIFSQIYRWVYKRGYIFTDLPQGLQERIYIHSFITWFTR